MLNYADLFDLGVKQNKATNSGIEQKLQQNILQVVLPVIYKGNGCDVRG